MSTSNIRSYLSRNDLYTLSWACYPVVCILFVAFHLKLATNSVADGVDDAKRALAASCNAAQKAATVAVSLPRYLAQGTNDEINNTIRDTLHATQSAFGLVLTAVQAIISFVIDSYKGLYLCIFQFVIRGALALMIEATNTTKKFLATATPGLADGVQSSISAANQAASGAVSAANSVINAANSFINSIPQICPPFLPCTPRPNTINTITPPTISFDVNQIRNFNIPDTLQQQIIALNSSLPTLDQLRNRLDQLVGVPFDLVRTQMNTTFTQVSNQIGNVTLPVPAVRTVEFCSEMDTSFIDTLGRDLTRIANICIGVLVACAVLLVLWNCIVIWVQWKRLSHATQVVRTSWAQTDASAGEKGPARFQVTRASLMTLDVQMQYPFAWRLLNYLTRVLALGPVARDRLAWFLAFIFHPAPLTCLIVGLCGILFICIQLIAVRPLQARVAQKTDELTADVTRALGASINSTLTGDSQAYARAMNTALDGVRHTLDTQLFAWIDTATGALNATVAAYYAELQGGVTTAFGASPLLAAAARQFVDCVLGSKVDAVAAATAFLRTHLHVALPTVPDDVLLLSPALLREVAQPVADAAVGGGDGGDGGGLFGALLGRYLAELRSELIMFGTILGVWALVVLVALGMVAWDAWRARSAARPAPTPPLSPAPSLSPVRTEKERPEAAPLPGKSTIEEDMRANLPPVEKDMLRALHKDGPVAAVKEGSKL